MSSEWCQNKKCPEKRNQNQIRGSKGAKYYQSNKANTWIGYWCSNGCRDTWWQDNKNTCIQAVGFIDKQVLKLDDAWYVEYRYDYREEMQNRYHLRNILKGVDQPITREQAQSPEDIANGHNWNVISQADARELAVELGIAS
jgi:hypothetical protein